MIADLRTAVPPRGDRIGPRWLIKPTLAGVETAEDMCKLEVALADRYGPASADQIYSANALRMLYDYRWPS